jgi:hypothetical protein
MRRFVLKLYFAVSVLYVCVPLTRASPSAVPLKIKRGVFEGFHLLPSARTGIVFSNTVPVDLVEQNRILENGSGVALGDVDGDGLCDIYFCSLIGTNRLYRNLGNLKFQDVSTDSGVSLVGQKSTGAVFADVDGDGDLDLLVNSLGGGTRFYLNDGHGHFSEALNSGLAHQFGATSMALADIDGDGDLDLYVTNYRSDTIRDSMPPDFRVEMINGQPVAHPNERFEFTPSASGPQLSEKGEPDILYKNDGHGHFEAVSWADGTFLDETGKPLTEPPRHWGLSAMFHDLNGDGIPDLYVCNDFLQSPDDIWIGLPAGRFQRIAKLAIRNTSWSSMAIDFSDINLDGHPDMMVVDMLSRDNRLRQTQRANLEMAGITIQMGAIDDRPQNFRNTLFLNRGDGTFAEIAQLSGVQASDWSWSLGFMDVDLDGFEDILIATGNAHDITDADTAQELAPFLRLPPSQRPKTLSRYPSLARPKVAFRNNHDLTFTEVGSSWGFNQTAISHGMAFADLDNDGDLDVVINNFNSVASVYENVGSKPRLAVRLKGVPPNTQGIGARITLKSSSLTQTKEVTSGGRYLSGDWPLAMFAVPAEPATIQVDWRSGRRSVVSSTTANTLYEISEADAEAPIPAEQTITQGPALFEDLSSQLKHVHTELPFDDYLQQQLIPHRFSQMGPGVAWFDLDGDGWEDLVIGSGRGGKTAFYHNNQHGSFVPLPNGAIAASDQAGLVGWSSRGTNRFLVAQSNYEGGGRNMSSVVEFGPKLNLSDLINGQTPTAGPLAMGDLDGDGDLDLFVGSRVVPGHFPEPSVSRLYRNHFGQFRLDRSLSMDLSSAGMVSGAVFSDLDGDGKPELLLACDYGPIRIFRYNGRNFVEETGRLGFAKYVGRWNGISSGDFDGDGRMDIIASNWGRNSKFQRFMEKPLELYYGDLNRDGRTAVVESFFDPDSKMTVPWRSYVSLARSLSFLPQKFPSYKTFAQLGVKELLDGRMTGVKKLEIDTVDTMLFLNRGDHFEPRPLPRETQFAPAFGISVADFDGDGAEDIFLGQNFFAVTAETSRFDAGRGLLLRGDGHGAFTAVPGEQSGLLIYGEQRGCAAADFDHDGRIDLVVSQNAQETRLFRNVRAKPGLRVILKGSRENPQGIGAKIRLFSGEVAGPAREVHTGSGYWSQEGAVQVMAASGHATQISVQWPGGMTLKYPVPDGSSVVEVAAPAEAAGKN